MLTVTRRGGFLLIRKSKPSSAWRWVRGRLGAAAGFVWPTAKHSDRWVRVVQPRRANEACVN